VSVFNYDVSQGSALLVIGTTQVGASFTDGLIEIPAMGADETVQLQPIKLSINRSQLDQQDGFGGALFEGGAIVPCVMPEPVLGASLPESDPAIATIDEFVTSCADPDFQNPNWRSSLTQPPKVEFTPERTYLWNMITSAGTMTFELLPGHAPHHVSNIIYLVRTGFYDDLSFHRVVQNFMAQGGDPLGNGTGGPDYGLAGEYDPTVSHAEASLSTANSGAITDGSQFFITFVATPHLDGKHTVSGRLVAGSDGLEAIHALAAASNCGGSCAPSTPVTITGGEIVVQ